MASTLLEETRQYHEDMERLERLVVKDFKSEAKSHKDKLMQSHRVRKMLDSVQDRASKLAKIYADEDGSRKEEIASLRGDNVYSNFYDRLKELRDYHRRFPSADVTEAESDEGLLGVEPAVAFSGEEGMGRYLDLHEAHQAWVNAPWGEREDYYAFVAGLPGQAGRVARPARLSRPYRDYLGALLAYLESFYERTQPLASLQRMWARVEEEFGARWDAGEVEGWEDRGEGGAAPRLAVALVVVVAAPAEGAEGGEGEEAGGGGGGSGALDLDAFESAEALEAVGGERLKSALAALGLKCGGTPAQRAARLMAAKGKDLSQLPKSLFAKGAAPAAAMTPAERARQSAAARSAALLEAKVGKLCEALGGVLEDTKGRIEKKAAQTYEELMAEQEEAEEEAAPEGSDSEDEYVYNPLRLPLGWDGKPIPYWLYKLHGLNMEFKCEICGNASYWGRRAYERHFKEYQHAAGMKALGIPNTKQFFEVTTIADAVALHKSLAAREGGGFKGEEDEEFEDTEGNVFNRKTYMDLQRQGLI